jgi:hypothetical protein
MAACKFGFVKAKLIGSDSEQDNSLFYKGVAQKLNHFENFPLLL